MAKKDPCRFTVMFNRTDSNHLQVAEMLNRQGHRKAQFIVNAVLHYMNCTKTPAIQAAVPLDKQAILEIIVQYLEERERGFNEIRSVTKADKVPQRPLEKKIPASTEVPRLDEAEALLGEEGLVAIADTMASFFGK